MPHALTPRPLTFTPDQQALLPRASQIHLQHKIQRRGHKRQNDGKAPKAPAPADMVVELIARLGSRKRSDHVRRGRERIGQATVLQARRIGGDHIDAVDHAAEADRVEHLGGAESRQARAGRHKDEPQCREGDHEEKALGAAPQVEHLGQWDVDGGAHGVGDDVDDGEERVRFEGARGEGDEVVEDRRLECVDEVEEPHP